jgi:3,4-dihydroxy-2-butanone 4-phosphate synthase
MRAVETFARGGAVLVGDDGRRENEADLVFHALHASPALVNVAIRKACGLLCVSVSNEIADRLGIPTAPKWPGGMAHTGFTLSVDARHNITSGISATDRAKTIALMAEPTATQHDFLSPGHVFPVRAQDGGLLARTGHTEAVLELCALAGLPAAAAMCEILDQHGEALRPNSIERSDAAQSSSEMDWWRTFPYVSTVDLLWHRLLCSPQVASVWRDIPVTALETERPSLKAWRLTPLLEADVLVPASIALYSNTVRPEALRIRLTNGFRTWCNSVPLEAADAELCLWVAADATSPSPLHITDFCDLSAKEGLRGTHMSVRRVLTQLRALNFLSKHCEWNCSLSEALSLLTLPVESDRGLLAATWEL